MQIEGWLCVCCMSTSDLLELSQSVNIDGEQVIYADLLEHSFNIKFSVSENASICEACAEELQQVYKFAKKTFTILAILDSTKVPPHIKLLKAKKEEDVSEYEAPEVRVLAKRRRRKRGRKSKFEVVPLPADIRKFQLPKLLDSDRVCVKCGLQFGTAKSLREHYNLHYPRFKCDRCGKSFASVKRARNHAKVHKEGPFKCPTCGEEKNSYNSLESHKRVKHSSSPLFPCNVCGDPCRTYIARRRHLFEVHKVNTYTYKCEICDKSFISSCIRKKHIKMVHLNIKDQQCNHCDRAFKDRQRLRYHLEHAHNIGQKRFQCDACKKRFSRKTTLITHMLVHSKEKRYICAFCYATFSYRSVLKSHLKKHASLLHHLEHPTVIENDDLLNKNTVVLQLDSDVSITQEQLAQMLEGMTEENGDYENENDG